jgi:hypothetical protein
MSQDDRTLRGDVDSPGTFGRYAAVLMDTRTSLKTKALCGRLVVADARFSSLVAILHGLGHRGGPLTVREWWSYSAEGEQVRIGFDDGWARFVKNFKVDTWDEVDDELGSVITSSTIRLEELIARFPDEDRMIEW